jgi:hypothetical protein
MTTSLYTSSVARPTMHQNSRGLMKYRGRLSIVSIQLETHPRIILINFMYALSLSPWRVDCLVVSHYSNTPYSYPPIHSSAMLITSRVVISSQDGLLKIKVIRPPLSFNGSRCSDDSQKDYVPLSPSRCEQCLVQTESRTSPCALC